MDAEYDDSGWHRPEVDRRLHPHGGLVKGPRRWCGARLYYEDRQMALIRDVTIVHAAASFMAALLLQAAASGTSSTSRSLFFACSAIQL